MFFLLLTLITPVAAVVVVVVVNPVIVLLYLYPNDTMRFNESETKTVWTQSTSLRYMSIFSRQYINIMRYVRVSK